MTGLEAAASPAEEAFRAHVASHYDELDVFYRRLWGEHVHHGLWLTGDETTEEAVIRLLERVAEHGAFRKGMTVCDAGCGYGATGRWLWQRYHAAVTGYTISPVQHAHAQRNQPPGHRYVLADWLHNTEADFSFDRVIAIESTEHMGRPIDVARETLRLLRPGGRFLVAAWLAAPDGPPWYQRLFLEPIAREGALSRGLPTLDTWHASLAAAGFDEITSDLIGDSVRRTWSILVHRVLEELTRRSGWAYLLDSQRKHRRFVLTVFRIWLAYRVGALDYGVIAAHKPD